MRARRANDYGIWKEAVHAKSLKDFARIDKLALKLKTARTYKGPDPRR